MEFGLTIPLMRYQKLRVLPAPSEPNLLFCWDLHRIILFERDCLLVVHAGNRFSFVLYDLSFADWNRLASVTLAGMDTALRQAEIPTESIRRYFACTGGERNLTRTHGRRPVAFLNRAWERALSLDILIDPAVQFQSRLTAALNSDVCRCASRLERGKPLFWMQEDFKQL